MKEESVFGLGPEQLDRLLSIGTAGDSPADGEEGPVHAENGRADSLRCPPSSVAAVLEQPGGWVGRYKLLSVLGEGGMGIVYLAEQAEPIKRQVAVKVIKPGMDSARVIARFEAERQALARLDHPNIAHVHDAGTTEAGRPYFVMEYVEGPLITDYCDEHKLPIEQRLRLFQQVCEAVQHAHQKGIIHRDIKPSNILVSTEGDKAIPKIIDFGVAKAMAAPLTERTLETEDSRLLGTPEYMSPEQADMASEDIDTRSDVYSLGVMLYVLLAGIMPYDSETFRQGGVEHVRKIIRESDPKTPSTRLTRLGQEAATLAESRGTEVAALARRLHKELEWIPLKAMRKERSERYRSATELADDIGNYLNGEPLIAGPPGTLYRFRKLVRRNVVLSAAVLAVAVTLILGLAGTTAMYLRAERAVDREAAARADAERALSQAQAITDFLTADVLGVVSDANAHEQSISYVLDAASSRLEGKFEDQPLVEATIRGTLGWTYHEIAQQAKARPHLEIALRLYEQELGEGHPKTREAMHNLGWVYMHMNRLEDAERLLSRLYAPDLQGGEEQGLLQLGFLYSKLGKYKEAEACYLNGISRSRREKGTVPKWTCANLAAIYLLQGRYQEAEQMHLQALAVWPEQGRSRNYKAANLADAYRGQARYQEAQELYKATLLRQQQTWGERDGMYTMLGLAQLYTDWGEYEKADEWFFKMEEALATPAEKEDDWGSAEPEYCNGLAVLRTRQGRFPEAEDLFKKAQAGWMQKLGDRAGDHPHVLGTINDFGVLRREQQRYDEAEALLSQALDGRQRRLGADLPPCFESMHELALVYVATGDYDKAEPLLLDAFHGREAKLGPVHPHTIDTLRELVRLYDSWDKPDEAATWRAKLPGAKSTDE